MPDIGTMHQLNPEPPHIGTMHQLGSEPLHTGEIITPQAQAEEYAREAQESADNAALSAAAAQSAAETAQQAAESIAPALDEKADAIHTAAGPAPIVSIPDAAAAPADALTVGIEPVQDLHGYDNPWPAGGGKNKLTIPDANFTISGISFISQNGKITINGTNTTGAGNSSTNPDYKTNWSFTIPAGTYYFSRGSFTTPTYLYHEVNGTIEALATNNGTFTIADQDTIWVGFYISATASFSNVVPELQLEIGSVKTDFAPVSNLCPISGFEGLTVWDTGKNMINPSELVYVAGGHNVLYGIHLPPDTDFVFSTDSIITGLYVAYSDDDEMPSISGTGWTEITYKCNTTSLRFNSGSHKWYRLMTYEINGVIRDRLYQLELGTTSTTYEPYQGETYPITFPSEAGTVYGGTLDVTNGGLTVDRAQIASYNGETLPGEWISDRDVYAQGNTPTTGAQVVYELATPVTYQLTPQEIRTLLGANNIWSDTGDVTVGYKADTKLYIDKKFAELQALILEN